MRYYYKRDNSHARIQSCMYDSLPIRAWMAECTIIRMNKVIAHEKHRRSNVTVIAVKVWHFLKYIRVYPFAWKDDERRGLAMKAAVFLKRVKSCTDNLSENDITLKLFRQFTRQGLRFIKIFIPVKLDFVSSLLNNFLRITSPL